MEKVARKICLDSDVIIHFLRKDSDLLTRFANEEVSFYTTSINLFEIWYGKKKGEVIPDFISHLFVVGFGADAAILAAEIMSKLKEKGDVIDYRDVFIAALCISNKLELFTLNLKHFERLQKFGLRLASE